jgi:4-carboxymuconolactone decarboxylase
MMQAPRFPRLEPAQMTPLQRQVAAEIAAGPRGEVRGPFVALIHHPELARQLQGLGEQLRWKAKLPKALLEMAVLITARRWTCQHEWFIHSKLALEAGLGKDVVSSISQNKKPEKMTSEEAMVFAFCREAHDSGRVNDKSFEAVKGKFGREGALELLALCGYYSLMAMVLNTAGLPLPGNAEPPLK